LRHALPTQARRRYRRGAKEHHGTRITSARALFDLSDPFVLSEVEALAKRIAFDCAQAERTVVQLRRKPL